MHGWRRPRPWRHACAALALLVGGPCAKAQWALWHDEAFSRSKTLDAAFWRSEEGFIRNQEAQYYRAVNAFVEGGALVLEARREAVPNAAYRPGARDWRFSRPQAAYTSAALVAREPLRFGRVEVVARSPAGAGTWPAIWLLHEGAGVYGEIDLFEAVGKHPDTVFAAVHYGRTAGTRIHRNGHLQVPGLAGSWRTHTLEWTPQRIVASVDGQVVFSFDPGTAAGGGIDPLREPMSLHINLALGGNWGGPVDDTRLPARLEIASVRVWRWTGDAVPAAAATAAPSQTATATATATEAARAAPLPPAARSDTAVAAPAPDAAAAAIRWGR